VQKVSAHPTQQRPINGRSGATKESPCPLAEMRKRWVGVLQANKQDNPMVSDEVWHDVNHEEVREGSMVGVVCKGRGHSDESDVGHDDAETRRVIALEERGPEGIVVRSRRVFLVSERVNHEICLQPKGLLEE